MGLLEELQEYVRKTHSSTWTHREGQKVPEYTEVALSNDAVDLQGTVLYADLAESTALVKGYQSEFAAEIYKNYLYCAAKIIVMKGGTVTSYDGDRVMGVFIGDGKNSAAAKCALNISYAVDKILIPAIKNQYPNSPFVLRQKIGIDTSALLVARTGIRGSNDLVWVGNSANNAAKLAALSLGYSSYISQSVYEKLNEGSKFGGDPKRDMWTPLNSTGLDIKVYASSWWWSF